MIHSLSVDWPCTGFMISIMSLMRFLGYLKLSVYPEIVGVFLNGIFAESVFLKLERAVCFPVVSAAER